jgi:hypothetical protein
MDIWPWPAIMTGPYPVLTAAISGLDGHEQLADNQAKAAPHPDQPFAPQESRAQAFLHLPQATPLFSTIITPLW